MKLWENITRLVVGLVFIGLASIAHAQDDEGGVDGKAELLRLKIAYQKSLNEIHQSHEAKVAKLGTRYAEALDKLLAKVKQAGDLDKALAVTNEIKRFGEEKDMSAKLPNSSKMVGLRSTYQTHASTDAADAGEETLSLISKYDKALDQLQKNLVRADKLAEAKLVQDERKSVIGSAEYRNAKRGLASRPKPENITASKHRAGDELTNHLGMTLCWIPPGDFIMGSPKDEEGRSSSGWEDQVSVTISSGFWIGKFEVTQEEYETLTNSNPSFFKDAGKRVRR